MNSQLMPTLKFCPYNSHSLPATAEYFYRDKYRHDGLDFWCKLCRREWNKAHTHRPRTDTHTGPIVLTLPKGQRFPAPHMFNSRIRTAADEALENNRVVVVTNSYHGSTWRWRQWKAPGWDSLDLFFEEHLGL